MYHVSGVWFVYISVFPANFCRIPHTTLKHLIYTYQLTYQMILFCPFIGLHIKWFISIGLRFSCLRSWRVNFLCFCHAYVKVCVLYTGLLFARSIEAVYFIKCSFILTFSCWKRMDENFQIGWKQYTCKNSKPSKLLLIFHCLNRIYDNMS